mgnify:CR=1 FL=1
MTDDDEGVGYGKPPKHSRFQKGQSGNPFGRRGQKPKPETQSEIVRRIRDEMVTIKMQGREAQVTAFEAAVRNVFNKTMQRGNPRDLKLLLGLLQEHGEMSAVDEGQRAKEGADAVYNKIMTLFCREHDIDEEEHATSERRRREEIEILFTFPQAIAALRKYWRAEDKTKYNETVHWTHLRVWVEKQWREM